MRNTPGVALITGGASGIGAAAASRLSRDGNQVAVADIDEVRARSVAAEIAAAGGTCVAFGVDLADPTSVNELIDATVDRFGSLDTVFNAAGILEPGTATEISIESWNRTISVNLTGTFNVCRAAIAVMLTGPGGAIINTSSSTGAHDAIGGLVGYVASKGGVTLLTKALAIDYATQGVRINAIAPGPTDTPMLRTAVPDEHERAEFARSLPMQRLGTPDEIAAVVSFLASPDASFITGAIIPVDGGQTAHV
ncbi:MAG: SDR family oxidoreductase [Proteobacteria bacterium]|nr:SDR family oxidoreductase [Actinomycetes bacterium]NHZ70509.1 SDR family oxidoreductase [Pseudomonadota bacterium]